MPDNRDPLITRGVYRTSALGTSLFVGLRTADIFLQYGILAKGLADPLLTYLNVFQTPNLAPAIAFGLPLQPLLILAMAVGSSLKHSYWVTLITREEMSPSSATIVAIFNTVFNSANSILSLTTAANAFMPSTVTAKDDNGASILLIGCVVSYLVGLGLEAISETQRKAFKDDPKNKGKLYTGGLFGLARHINYGGYTVWRASYAFASGGWIWGAFVAAFFTYDFGNRAIPVLDEYCGGRYGASWEEYKKKVPYKFLPGVF